MIEQTDSPESALLADLVIHDATLVVTMDDKEIAGGWVAVTDGIITAVGEAGDEPPARRHLSASGCLLTPGFVNTHHHMYQNLTRNCAADKLEAGLVPWLEELYPTWVLLDDESSYLSTYVALSEMALGGCTTASDHLNIHPRPHLIDAQIRAAADVGLRFHPTRGAMDLSQKDGCLPPDSAVESLDQILEDFERLVAAYHDPTHGAMVRIALAPCNPFAVSSQLMTQTAEMAERLDVRLHTHLAESPDEESYCLEKFGWRPAERLEALGWDSDRVWTAHGIYLSDSEIERLGRNKVGVAHCPTSNILFNRALTPVRKLLAAGAPVGLGCDGGASAGHNSLYNEARLMALAADLLPGTPRMTARDALHAATRGGAECLGRGEELGRLAPGFVGDIVAWPVDGLFFSGVQGDLVTAWLRNGPLFARHTLVGGEVIVMDGALVDPNIDDVVRRHHAVSGAWHEAVA